MVEWKKTRTSSSPRGSVYLQVIQLGTLRSSWSKVVPGRQTLKFDIRHSLPVLPSKERRCSFRCRSSTNSVLRLMTDWFSDFFLFSLSPRLTFVYYVYCSCHTLFWSKEESTLIVLYENYSLVTQYTQQQTLKGRPWPAWAISNRFHVIRSFHFGWRRKFGGFGGKLPHKTENFENTCLEDTSLLRETASCEPLCVKIG